MIRRRLAAAVSVALVVTGLATGGTARARSPEPSQSRQWNLSAIGAPSAWMRALGAGVRIGIVDTGIDIGHVEFAGKVVARADCTGSGGEMSGCRVGGGAGADDNGHGTHVAGIAAAAVNGTGIAGVAPAAELVVAKALEADSGGTLGDIRAGIEWVVSQGADVVNVSIGTGLTGSIFGSSSDLGEALDYAWEHGAVPVVAAGNNGSFLGLGSANYGETNAITVTATGPDGKVTGYSSPIGTAKWGIAAPGGEGSGEDDPDDVYSTWWEAGKRNQYGTMRGTSMAAPHVAGTIALLLSAGASRTAAVAHVLGSARPVPGGCGSGCSGALDAAGALARVPRPTTTTTVRPHPGGGNPNPGGGAGAPGTPVGGLPDSHVAAAPVPLPARPAGYVVADSAGGVRTFGGAPFQGEVSGNLKRPIVGLAEVPGLRLGYWLVASDGGVFSFGDAGFHGSTGAISLNQPIVGMSATKVGAGYWLVASDGGIFSFGDAGFYGSTGAMRLNQPIVGMVPTPTSKGYWLVASDGGIFSFGDARFYGSTGGTRLNKPIVGMAATPSGQGYWLVASDGGIFSFGDARFYGSTGAISLNQPIVGMGSPTNGGGYWLVAADGGIFSFGRRGFLGSAAGTGLGRVVGIAAN
ncbi:MAG: S8 family serine peptidase [Acidimicrobiia bacterium]